MTVAYTRPRGGFDMMKQGRGSVERARADVLTLAPMQPTMRMLGRRLGGSTVGALAPPDTDAADVPPWAVGVVPGWLKQQLSPREEQVVRLRYGIGTRTHTVDEISEQLGVLPRLVVGIELRAVRKLRESSVGQPLFENPGTRPEPFRGGNPRPAGPGEPPRLPDEPDREAYPVNPWDEV
jgi:hypothetical protein